MATTFKVGTIEEAAAATLELFARAKSGTILDDQGLLANQLIGVAGVAADRIIGSPQVVVPIGDHAISEDEALDILTMVSVHGEPKSGIVGGLSIKALLTVLKAIVPLIPADKLTPSLKAFIDFVLSFA